MDGDTKVEEPKTKPDVANDSDPTLLKKEVGEGQKIEENVEDLKKKATLLFLQGKRSVFIRDYQAAVVTLSEACQIFSQIYPEQDEALADPYFYCGKALLEVARSESEVLGDQVQDDNEDDDEEEEENDEEGEEGEGESETNGTATAENGVSSTEGNGVNVNKKETVEEGSGDKASEDNENGEVNDLQLSWEYLELAKLIYLRKADVCKETAIKLAETYLCLGENGLESENYSTAIEDIKEALKLQIKHLREEDRRIAETYYQLGVAHSLCQNYDEAIESFNKSIDQLRIKISSLEMRKKIGDKKTEEEEKDAFYTMDGEIDEIKLVIKDVEEKIKDMVESKNQVKADLVKQVCGAGGGGDLSGSASSTSNATGASSSSSIPATDISHLVRKKRKNDEPDETQEKKPKTDN